jgi:hypothetical protein
MYEVDVLKLKNDKVITKIFWNKKRLIKYLEKIEKNKKLKLLCITDNSYLYE